MSFVPILLLGVFLLAIILIALQLYSLAKQGDERKNMIKTKAMAETFSIIIGILVIEIGVSVYASFTGGEPSRLNPFTFLVVITIFYFISLLVNKNKYGG